MKENKNKIYTCPACGFLMFDEPTGSFDICELCGWEDDNIQLSNPRLRGGANKGNLIEAQIKALKTYPIEVKEIGKFKRDPEWRPLKP